MECMIRAAAVFTILWPLVYCQTYPYVSFMGQNLSNNSYVDLSRVGSAMDGSDSVRCHTDLSTCCSGSEGYHRGDWVLPTGTRLQFTGDIYEGRGTQIVQLHRQNSATSPSGVYCCNISTVAFHHKESSLPVVTDKVCVGLYTEDKGSL